MSKIWWTKMEHVDDFVAHYSELSDSEIVVDVRRSIASFANHRPEGDDFGAKMVRKALDRINEKHDHAVEAGSLGGIAKAAKTITAAATTREGVDVVPDRESGSLVRTTGCNNMRRVPQNEAPAHGFSGGRTAQGTMSRSPEAAAQSGKDYDKEAIATSTNSPAGAGVNLDSTHTISPDASVGNAEGVYLHGSVSTSATSGQTITTAETLDKASAGEVPPENVSKKTSPALPAKHPHGEFGNVMLTDDEFAKLCEKCADADSLITELDQYIESQGKTKKYKSHYATLLNWSRRKAQEAKPQQRYKNINDINQENYEKAMREIEAMCAGEVV